MLRITSKKEGFRRCGVAHSRRPVEYANDYFSEKELEILRAESMLVVEEIVDAVDHKETKDKKSDGKAGQDAPAAKAVPDILDRDK